MTTAVGLVIPLLTASQKEVVKKQKPLRRKEKKTKVAMVVAVKDKDNDFFAFTCTSDYADVAESSKFPKSRYGTCVDSGVSNDYSPDQTKFLNYREIGRSITTADGRTLKAVGMGDLHIDLPNGSKCSSHTGNGLHTSFYQQA